MQIKEQESKSGKLYSGISEVKVIAVNPTNEEKLKLFGVTEPTEEQLNKPEYEYFKDSSFKYKNSEGEEVEKDCKQLQIDIWVECQKTKLKRPITFFLKDVDRVSKDGLKTQYINCTGFSLYVDSEENLKENFTNFISKGENLGEKEYRIAKVGEDALYSFLVAFSNLDTFWPQANIFLDSKKLWKGDVSELRSFLLSSEMEGRTTMVCFGVKMKDTDEGTKEFQSVCNNKFCPGKFMPTFRTLERVDFQGLDRKKMYHLYEFINGLKDSEYGYKEYFLMKEITEYDPSVNPLSSDEALVKDSSSPAY